MLELINSILMLKKQRQSSLISEEDKSKFKEAEIKKLRSLQIEVKKEIDELLTEKQ